MQTGETREYEQSTRAGSNPMLSSVSLSPAISNVEMLYEALRKFGFKGGHGYAAFSRFLLLDYFPNLD
jgi:hypothetical protein